MPVRGSSPLSFPCLQWPFSVRGVFCFIAEVCRRRCTSKRCRLSAALGESYRLAFTLQRCGLLDFLHDLRLPLLECILNFHYYTKLGQPHSRKFITFARE